MASDRRPVHSWPLSRLRPQVARRPGRVPIPIPPAARAPFPSPRTATEPPSRLHRLAHSHDRPDEGGAPSLVASFPPAHHRSGSSCTITPCLPLRARCRACHHSISWRYPAVELLTGLLFAVAAWRAVTVLDLVASMIFLAALVVISGIDLDHQIIPASTTFPGIVIGALLSLLGSSKSWLDVLLGILVGGGPFVLIILLTAGRGMGGGDPKLGAMIGAFLGWKLALLAILIGVWSGGAVAIALLATGRKGRKAAIPFGPFLALGGVISLLWGRPLLAWYLGG